jgi:multiple sugar transport system substrate-binding protein
MMGNLEILAASTAAPRCWRGAENRRAVVAVGYLVGGWQGGGIENMKGKEMEERLVFDRLSRRRLAGMAGAGLAGAALAACGGPPAGEAQLANKPEGSVPLLIWARGASDKTVFDQIAPLVTQRYPHLAINTEAVTGINDKIVVGLAGGGAADLAVVNMPFGVPMMGQNAFVKLQPYLARDKEVDQELKSFAAPGLQAYRYRNELYAIPITSESIVLWYNEDLVRQANLPSPSEIEDDPQKWNWDTVLDYARKLNRGRDQARDVFGLYVGPGVQASWGNLVHSNGGRILTEDAAKMTLSEAPAVEAIQWAVDTIWKHDVGPQPATLKEKPNRTLFAEGRLAMVWDGEYFRRYLYGVQTPQGVPFKFNLAQLPFAPRTRKRADVYHALALPMLRDAKLPDAAWEYLRVFASKAAQQFITDNWGSRGGNQKTYEPWLKANAGGGPPANYAAIVKADAYGVPYPASPYLPSNELTEAMDRLMPQIFDNAVAVRTTLQEIDQQTNAKLEPAARAAKGQG